MELQTIVVSLLLSSTQEKLLSSLCLVSFMISFKVKCVRLSILHRCCSFVLRFVELNSSPQMHWMTDGSYQTDCGGCALSTRVKVKANNTQKKSWKAFAKSYFFGLLQMLNSTLLHLSKLPYLHTQKASKAFRVQQMVTLTFDFQAEIYFIYFKAQYNIAKYVFVSIVHYAIIKLDS